MARAIEKVMKISSDPKHIRNVCTSAHIHHGKTAFSDNLIAAAGLMSQDLAGDALLLNFRQDEIDRCMTIDSSNISMVHPFEGQEYLVNLIDTPGHVDFGGDVTRAMRAVDGTVLLVCASEGVMPQTETVLKQALKERVKPVLFINKVDRLITELKLSPEKIQEKFVGIIAHVNRLIRQIAEKEYGDKWQVSVGDGSVAFGSARHNWGLSLTYMKKKNVSFKDIITIYETMTGDERDKALFEKAPLYEVVMDMVVKHLPDPQQAQAYRIPKIWHGDIESPLGQSLRSCDPKGKLAFVVNKIIIEPQVGEVSYGRLFSGTISKSMEVYLNREDKKQRIQQIFIAYGQKKELIDTCACGNILGLVGVKTQVGETITLEPEEPFEELSHIFDPVITKSIEAKSPGDLSKLLEVLRQVNKEDPTVHIEINEETGEHLISGMGELHLEVIENRIKTEKNVDVKTSPPIVVYRETIKGKNAEPAEGKSPNKHNKIYFQVEPIEPEIAEAFRLRQLQNNVRVRKKDEDIVQKFLEFGYDTKVARGVRDICEGNLLIDGTRGVIHIGEIIELVMDMFEDVMKKGPIAHEPCFGIKVTILDCKLHEDAIHRGPAQLYPAVREGIRDAMRMARPTMFEPVQTLQFEAPTEYMGEISKLITNKRGMILDMEQSEHEVVVKGKIPVAEMIGMSSELRSATGGRGTSSIVDQAFERLPEELQDKIVRQIRERKGLTDNQ